MGLMPSGSTGQTFHPGTRENSWCLFLDAAFLPKLSLTTKPIKGADQVADVQACFMHRVVPFLLKSVLIIYKVHSKLLFL